VSAAIISFFEFQHLDEYLYISGQTLDPGDLTLLREYDRQIAGSYCAPHCGACLSSCPEGLPIADVLRHRMYFEDYHDEKEAMRLYAALETNAEVCLGCNAPCAGSCPLGIDIRSRTVAAHEMLTLQAAGEAA
jgi:Predicted oxidoreductases of the aldo/keto reductase family